MTVSNDGSGTEISGEGTARIILSYPGADDVVLPAVIVIKQTLKATSS